MTWIILIIVIWLLAKGAVPNIDRNIVSQNKTSEVSLICKIGLILTLTLMVGFWGVVAEDHDEYIEWYHYFSGQSLSDLFDNATNILRRQAIGLELGYNVINVLGNYLNLKGPLFLTLTALFVNICVVKFIYDYPQPVLSLFLLLSTNFFLMEANLVRQVLAMAIFSISIESLLEGKWKIYILLIFVATLFHTSAIALAFFAVFHFAKSNKAQRYTFYALVSMWLISLLTMCGIVSINFISIFSDSAFSVYATDNNSISMEASVLNIAFHNIVVTALLLCHKSFKIDLKLIYYAVIIITASTLNISYVFPNILRFITYFSVVFYVFVIYLFLKSGKWRFKRHSIPILFLKIYCGLRILVYFILEDNIFGSKSYSLTDFF